MFGGNKFLMDHLKRQASLVHDEQAKVDAKKDAKGIKKSKNGTASGEPAFPMDLSVLISEKPGKKEVVDYFRDRITKLVAEEMD